jgi:hypothetical protein
MPAVLCQRLVPLVLHVLQVLGHSLDLAYCAGAALPAKSIIDAHLMPFFCISRGLAEHRGYGDCDADENDERLQLEQQLGGIIDQGWIINTHVNTHQTAR